MYVIIRFVLCQTKSEIFMDKVRQAIAERLKQARINAGFKTAKEFAEKYQLPIPAYGHHENGTRGIKPDVANNYCDLLNIHPAWLYTGDEYQQAQALNTDPNQQLSIDDSFAIIQFIYKNISHALGSEIADTDELINKSFAITKGIYTKLIMKDAGDCCLMKSAEGAVEVAIATIVAA